MSPKKSGQRPPPQVPPGVMLIDPEGPLDDMGRCMFFAYWRENNQWRGGNGIAGQVFVCDPYEFAARDRAKGWIVARADVLRGEPVIPVTAPQRCRCCGLPPHETGPWRNGGHRYNPIGSPR